MPVAWRIVKKKYQKDALRGEGARLFGGRWNSPGHAVVYAAETFSGALLEMLVHSDRQLLPHYTWYRLIFPDNLITVIDSARLPETWRDYPAPPELALLGDQWHAEGQSVVLRVPGAIVPVEYNYLINPDHDDFQKIEIEGPTDYAVDTRMGWA